MEDAAASHRSDEISGNPLTVFGSTASPCIDELAKSRKSLFSVIPAKAGIQCFKSLMNSLDPGFHRGDDFLRECHLF